MLAYNEIRRGKVIIYEGEPCLVMDSWVFRKQQRKPVNQTKLKNIITGKAIEYSFHQTDKVEEAELSKRDLRYLYQKKDEIWFSDPENPSDRMTLTSDIVGNALNFLRPNDVGTALLFNDNIIALEVPTKVQLKVSDAPPNIKGNTAQGGTKLVTVETGYTVNTPLFVETGDIIEINTETGEYVTRVEKA